LMTEQRYSCFLPLAHPSGSCGLKTGLGASMFPKSPLLCGFMING
jgi:hypothetical protein